MAFWLDDSQIPRQGQVANAFGHTAGAGESPSLTFSPFWARTPARHRSRDNPARIAGPASSPSPPRGPARPGSALDPCSSVSIRGSGSPRPAPSRHLSRTDPDPATELAPCRSMTRDPAGSILNPARPGVFPTGHTDEVRHCLLPRLAFFTNPGHIRQGSSYSRGSLSIGSQLKECHRAQDGMIRQSIDLIACVCVQRPGGIPLLGPGRCECQSVPVFSAAGVAGVSPMSASLA